MEVQGAGDYQDAGEFENLLIIAKQGCIVAKTIKNAVELMISTT